MTIELRVPAVGESITEVQIGDWLRDPGDRVLLDAPVVVIETDKATVELPAPASGTVTRVLKAKGERAAVGEVIGYMEEAEEAAAGAAERTAGRVSRPAAAGASATASASERAPRTEDHAAMVGPGDGARVAERRVMPAARRALAEDGLRVDEVTPTGPGGRVLKEDVRRAAAGRAATPAPAPPARRPPDGGPDGAQAAAPAPTREEEVVPMSMLRRRIAERLVEAQQTAALLTTFNEVDMSGVLALRREHQEGFRARYGIKLGFMSFFVKAAIDALKLVPQVNAELRGDSVVYKNYYDIGVAVGGGRGLVVPVLRDADRMSFAEVEVTIADLAKRAQENRLKVDELAGGTFTITNGGIYGSLMSTPIVNPPQSGILGMHAVQERPVARDGQAVIRPMMYVALTYDHRIVDGREAVTFLRRVKEVVETPARMLLEV